MAMPPETGLPEHAMVAVSFAESLARECAGAGRSKHDLFVALAGIVAVRDCRVAMDCLKALDDALCASAGSAGPSD